jgi:hypothetical protein
MRPFMSLAGTAVLAAAFTVSGVGPARAVAPESVTQHVSYTLAMAQADLADDPYSAWGYCGETPILSAYEVDRTTRTFGWGWERHFSFTGTLYNAEDTSRSVPYSGSANITFDDATSVLTIRGRQSTAVIDGRPVAIDVGSRSIDFDTFDVVTHGQHMSDDLPALCEALVG